MGSTNPFLEAKLPASRLKKYINDFLTQNINEKKQKKNDYVHNQHSSLNSFKINNSCVQRGLTWRRRNVIFILIIPTL